MSQTGSACPADIKLAMIDWFGPIFVESYGGTESGTLCRIDSTEWLAHQGSVGRPRPPFEVVVLDENNEPVLGRCRSACSASGRRRGAARATTPTRRRPTKAYLAPGVFTLGRRRLRR